jgi:hypothetical protein
MANGVRALALAGTLAMVGLLVPPARADNVSVSVSTPSASFGLQIGAPPPLLVVPGLPVYHAPSVPDNYFVYGGYYYLYHQGAWFYSHQYNGPWFSLVIHQVPQPVLSVPVRYYRRPPGHWKHDGPPPWAGHEREHDKGKGKHKKKERH